VAWWCTSSPWVRDKKTVKMAIELRGRGSWAGGDGVLSVHVLASVHASHPRCSILMDRGWTAE
jgi:hypothetical protein